MARVAFLGTGLLGSAMVEGMLLRGDEVTVWNRTESKARAPKARIARLNAAGVTFLHAPVFMSPQMAKDAVGIMMVSGPRAAYESVRSALEMMTGEVWYLGEQGDLAAAYKIFGNSMLFVIAAGVTDVFAMAKGLGIAPADALAVFGKFQPGNLIQSRGEKMARGDFNATFELTMARKDMRLMLEAAAGQPLTVFPAIAKAMDDAIAKGHGKDDLGAIAAQGSQ